MERTLTRISLKSSEDASQTFYHIQNFIFFSVHRRRIQSRNFSNVSTTDEFQQMNYTVVHVCLLVGAVDVQVGGKTVQTEFQVFGKLSRGINVQIVHRIEPDEGIFVLCEHELCSSSE